jgi:hypothetical protein
MISENGKLNIILGVICVVFIIVTIYIISYRHNLESVNVYFEINDIKNVTWKSNNMEFTTDGKTFNLTVNNVPIYEKTSLDLDTHTGEIIKDRLYLRSVGASNIVIWYEEAEYRLDKDIKE